MKTKVSVRPPLVADSRIVQVACAIAATQTEAVKNERRMNVLQLELDSLESRNAELARVQVDLGRQMDKMTASFGVAQ